MKVLVFGAKGWIGQQFINNTTHEVIVASTRPENFVECRAEIRSVRPDSVCSFIGRTYGPTNPTIDYLEEPGRLYENMRDNFEAPVHLAEICDELKIHYVYIGTGCIYTYTDDKKTFSEDDAPNFFGSSYSIIKGFTDKEIRRFSTSLQLRIRMPITSNCSSRNLLDKLINYKNVCSIPNSMTVLDDMWPIMDRMIMKGITGVYNMVNPGVVEHKWILEQYKSIINPKHTWVDVSYEEQVKNIKSQRSNTELTTVKLVDFCKENSIPLKNIQDAIHDCFVNRVSRS